MRAFLAIRDKCLVTCSDQNTVVVRGWIIERHRGAYRKVVEPCNQLNRRLSTPFSPEIFNHYPKLANDKRQACQNHEFSKIAAGNKMIVWPINREILPPFGLLGGRSSIGRDRNLLLMRCPNHLTLLLAHIHP